MKNSSYSILLLSTCLMTSSILFAVEELRVNDQAPTAGNRRATVYSPASQTSKKSVPAGASPNPALRPESVSQPGLHSSPARTLSSSVSAYFSAPQTASRPLPAGADYQAWWEDSSPSRQSPLARDSGRIAPVHPVGGTASSISGIPTTRSRTPVQNPASRTVPHPLPAATHSRQAMRPWLGVSPPRPQESLPRDSGVRASDHPAMGGGLRGTALIDHRLRTPAPTPASKTVQQPLPIQAPTRQTPKTGGNVRPAPVAPALEGTVRRQETEVRASRGSVEPSRVVNPIDVPNTIPSVVFSTANSQQQLVLNLNINNRTVSHTVDLINLSEIGQSQRFVSQEYVTTLTPDEWGVARVHVSRHGRRIAEGRFKVDSNKNTLLIERLELEESFHIQFAGKIIINRLESVSTDTVSSHLFITSGSEVVLGSDVNVNLNQLTINAKTFVQKGELRLHKFSCSVEELINDGTMEIQEVGVLRLLKKLTNNASLRFSQPRLSLNVPEFVNDGTLLGNDISIVSTKGRNTRLIKAITVHIKCEGVFANTGGEHDSLILVDKNQPDGLWGIHGDTIRG